jgi:transcriptional regulator with XRE-family HTH domain
MSQTELGTRLGVTFQQVQKYEKGVNRVGAGRLQRISDVLEIPITFFFGSPQTEGPADGSVLGFIDTAHALRLVRAYSRIPDAKVQRALVELAERLAPEAEA